MSSTAEKKRRFICLSSEFYYKSGQWSADFIAAVRVHKPSSCPTDYTFCFSCRFLPGILGSPDQLDVASNDPRGIAGSQQGQRVEGKDFVQRVHGKVVPAVPVPGTITPEEGPAHLEPGNWVVCCLYWFIYYD